MNFSRLFLLAALSVSSGYSINISRSTISLTADEQACTLGRPLDVFTPSAGQVFFGFTASSVNRGESLLIEWLSPQGSILQSTPYSGLPATGQLCFLTQLPVAGFEAATLPGIWKIRVTSSGRILNERTFQITADPNAGKFQVAAVERTPRTDSTEFTLTGSGFEPTSVIHIAQYTKSGGWKYLYRMEPAVYKPNQVKAMYAGSIPVGEYMVIVRNADGRISQPARLLIAADTGYKLPLAAGEAWVIAQGPYGGFSHFGRTSQAWDIAPINAKCVVAMRGGIAHTFDGGWGQTQHIRSFGNYITIAHDNGEFSHYAHLTTGSFQVTNGQRVEQGQAIAVVGNSGYTFGAGGGHHIHAQVTREFSISAQSIPFRFDDLPDPGRSLNRAVVSKNISPACKCGPGVGRNGTVAALAAAGNANKLQGAVQVEQWWSEVVLVKAKSGALDVALTWKAEGRDLDLHLISPTGKHYGPFYITDGYSRPTVGAEKIHVVQPEVGYWRVSVRGIQGPPGEIPFELESSAGLVKVASRQVSATSVH